MARQDAAAGRPVEAALVQLERTTARARALVQQILAFSRRQPPLLRALALRPLLDEVLTMLRATVPPRIQLVLEPGADGLFAQADASQLHQVLVNLVINAVQAFGGASGQVTLALEGETIEGRDWVVIEVSDNGPGMNDETLRRAFEPFFTTKPPGEGTGLGLSVAHGVVSAHGGRIELASRPGLGTQVRVLLPRLAAVVPEAGAMPPMYSDDGTECQGRVLLVDDDEVVRLVCAELLRRAGHTVTALAQADEALGAVRADPGAFDLVVTDYNMPQVSGVQLAESLRVLAPSVPVVLISGYLDEAGRERAQRAGVCAFIDKQHLAEQLLPEVRLALSSRRPGLDGEVGKDGVSVTQSAR
jgi:CheY-like chemotaxis protein/two-component sensor histidine kinase